MSLALPKTKESTSFGHPAFCVGKKPYVVLEPYRGRLRIVFKAEPPHQHALIESDPRFIAAPYIGKDGWVSLEAEGKLDWEQVRFLVAESHRLISAVPRTSAKRRSRSPNRSSDR
jgi:predicted DNA-binding protein (MmcQ/YjbR family)